MPEALEKLVVWQKAIDLADQVHHCAKLFPADERFDLTSQLRRAATSIPSNIAEGYGQQGTRNYVRFLCISRGSTYEAFTQLTIAQRRGYPVPTEVFASIEEVLRLLNSMISKLEAKYIREEPGIYGDDLSKPLDLDS